MRSHFVPSFRAPNRRIATAAAVLASLALVSCGSPASTDTSPGAVAPDPSAQPVKVSFALDWAANTNHIGVFVADELGYFAEAGLEVEILPYGSTSALQLVSAGEADFGIGGQSAVQMARTSGLDVVSVYSITQTDAGRLVVLADRDDLTRPSQLDGRVFGGFGAPLYSALAKATIQGDGGAGEFEEVVLDTGAYEALSQRRIDFTLSVATWENVQATLENRPYREFRYQDFGLPDQHSAGIVSSNGFLAANPETAAGFVQAVARGYAYAAENPSAAADLLIQANPDTLGAATDLVHASAELMAEQYLVAQGRPIGAADPEFWRSFGAFLFQGGFLIDAQGNPVTAEPDWSEYFTNEFLR